MPTRRPGQPITAGDLSTMKACIADGWPLVQIERTHGYSHTTMKKYFPEYSGMTFSEAGGLGLAMKAAP